MDNEPKTEEESWTVGPPKEGSGKAGKVLRVALIVAALAVAAYAGIVLFGAPSRPIGGILVPNPEKLCEEVVGKPTADTAESMGNTIAGGHDGAEGK